MQKSRLLSATALLLLFVLSISGCRKEEILPSPSPTPSSPEAFGMFPTDMFCCRLFGPDRSLCDWRQQMQRVLNCCYAETPMQFCTWDDSAPTYTSLTYFEGDPDWLRTPEEVKAFLDWYVSLENADRPGEGYLFESWEIEDLGTSETINGSFICIMGVTLHYRKLLCNLP